MSTLQSFPFKNMPKIINLLSVQEEIGVSEIARETGMCSFDSREVTDMLAFLTTFGRVEKTKDGWTILNVEKGSILGEFRKAFLESIEKILRQLSTASKSISQLAQETQLPKELVEEYLPFLEEITRLGAISRCSSASFPRSWCVLPFD
jgi:DNA-binding IclR family transcriptional regulator